MRKQKFQDILDAMKKSGLSGMGTFGPTADDKVVFRDYSKRLADGNFIKAPILIGNTDDEDGLTTALANLQRGRPAPAKGTRKRQTEPPLKLPNIACGPHAGAAGRVKHSIPAWQYVYNGVYPNQVR